MDSLISNTTNAIRKTMKSIQLPKRKSKEGEGRKGGGRKRGRKREREQTKIMKWPKNTSIVREKKVGELVKRT